MSDFDPNLPRPTPSVEAEPAEPVHNILFGSLGLRAGWGIVLFLIFAVAIGAATGYLAQASSGLLRQEVRAQREAAAANRHQGAEEKVQPIPRLAALAQEGEGALALLGATAGLGWIERRRFGVFGLRLRFLRDLLPGAGCGLVAMGALVYVLWALHLVSFDRQMLHGEAILTWGLSWLLIFVLVGLFEEFLFRGYLQFTLMRGLLGLARRLAPGRAQEVAFWMSALFWSLLFFLSHIVNAGETAVGLTSVFVAGVLFAYALWRTGSLWWGIGFHATWDWSQSFLYGVPDSGTLSVGRLFHTHPAGNPLLSGGAAGPEGSLFLLPILALVFMVLRAHRQRSQPPVEPSLLPVVHRGNSGAIA